MPEYDTKKDAQSCRSTHLDLLSLADALLLLSNSVVIVIGSYSFFKCIQKRGKTVATMARKIASRKKKKKNSNNGKEDTEETDGKKKKKTWGDKAHAKVHPI